MTKRAVIITSTILVAIVTILTILFGVVFRVRDIDIKYGDDFRYKEQVSDILASSKLKKNTSIFKVDRDKIDSNIETNFPYAKASVNISSFTSVKITLSNRTPLYYLVQEGIYYILDEECKVLDITNNVTDADKYILLTNVFEVNEGTTAGQFLDNNYTDTLNNLYNALYSNAMLEMDKDGDTVYEEQYLNREDICEVIKGVKFNKAVSLNGEVNKLVMTTNFGIQITIIEPERELDYKINSAFSALRVMQKEDREHSTNLATKGTIDVVYSYQGGECKIVCEYHEDIN